MPGFSVSRQVFFEATRQSGGFSWDFLGLHGLIDSTPYLVSGFVDFATIRRK
jgi:hypothetical protein